MDLGDLRKKYKREDLIMLASDYVTREVNGYPTGIPQLDLRLGPGGFPGGRITEIYGPPASGKTSLVLSTIAELHRSAPDSTAAFIDTENAWDSIYAEKSGVDLDRLYLSHPEWAEQGFDVAEHLIRSGQCALVCIDSIPALSPRAEMKGDVGDAHVGLLPRLLSQFLRRTAFAIRESEVGVILTNQVRDKIGRMSFKVLDTSGGWALKHHASVRIMLYNSGQIDSSRETPVGSQIAFTVKKNKVGPSFVTGTFQIWHDRGVCKEEAVLSLALDKGIVVQRGSWYSLDDGEKIAQGRVGAVEALTRSSLYENLLERMASNEEDV